MSGSIKCLKYKPITVDTGRKLNVHKTFRFDLCMFNLHPVSTEIKHGNSTQLSEFRFSY